MSHVMPPAKAKTQLSGQDFAHDDACATTPKVVYLDEEFRPVGRDFSSWQFN